MQEARVEGNDLYTKMMALEGVVILPGDKCLEKKITKEMFRSTPPVGSLHTMFVSAKKELEGRGPRR